MWNDNVPVKADPLTLRSAASVTCTEPVPIETSGNPLLLLSVRSAGGLAASCGVVVRPDVHCSNDPSRKSFSCAPIDGEDRVSTRKLEKHPSRPRDVRSAPPSIAPPA